MRSNPLKSYFEVLSDAQTHAGPLHRSEFHSLWSLTDSTPIDAQAFILLMSH